MWIKPEELIFLHDKAKVDWNVKKTSPKTSVVCIASNHSDYRTREDSRGGKKHRRQHLRVCKSTKLLVLHVKVPIINVEEERS